MNLAYECKSGTSLEKMRLLIKKEDYPIVLCDPQGLVIDKNTRAGYSVVPVKRGALIKRLLCGSSADCFETMRCGDIRPVEVSLTEVSGALAARFKDFFFFGFHLFPSALAGRLMEMDAYREETALDFMGLDPLASNLKSGGFKRGRLNASRLLNIVAGIRPLKRDLFDPLDALEFIEKYTAALLEEKDVQLVRTGAAGFNGGFFCNGSEDDFYSLLALLLAISAENSLDGKVYMEGILLDRRFCVSFLFKSALPPALSGFLCRNGFDCPPQSDVLEPFTVNILYIKHVTEQNGWDVRACGAPAGRLRFLLTVPVEEGGRVPFNEDYLGRRREHLRRLVLLQIQEV